MPFLGVGVGRGWDFHFEVMFEICNITRNFALISKMFRKNLFLRNIFFPLLNTRHLGCTFLKSPRSYASFDTLCGLFLQLMKNIEFPKKKSKSPDPNLQGKSEVPRRLFL
jgi:hypothetical protein